MKMNFIRVIVLAVGFFLGASECFVKAQVVDQQPKLNKKVGLGVFDHQEGRLFHGSFEFLLVKRLSLDPSIGFTLRSDKSFPITPAQKSNQYKYAGSIDAKLYFLLNRRYPLEGIFGVGHLGYYRSSVHPSVSNFVAYRGFQLERGLGVGGQYFVFPRWGICGNTMLNYVSASDYFLNPDGSIRYLYSRPGFIITYYFQIGFSF